MDADGSGVVRLTDDPGYDADPVWSPDESFMGMPSRGSLGLRLELV